MVNKETETQREIQIQGLIDRYLDYRPAGTAPSSHLDEDILTAFVEGNMSEREAAPATSHLVACSFCRQRSAELLKLGAEFSEEPERSEPAAGPVRVADVLSGILGRIFGSGEDAVFAHQEKSGEEDEEDAENDG